jgi:hypothetical protein
MMKRSTHHSQKVHSRDQLVLRQISVLEKSILGGELGFIEDARVVYQWSSRLGSLSRKQR